MNFGERIESFLIKHFAYVDISNSDGTTYLRRFFLLGGKGGSSLDLHGNLRKEEEPVKAKPNAHKLLLHIFYTGDEGNCCHDHPWDFKTLILAGGYYEITEVTDGTADIPSYIPGVGFKAVMHREKKWYGVGSFLIRKAEQRHMVKLEHKIIRTQEQFHGMTIPGHRVVPKRAWTLVIRGTKIRTWGFWSKGLFHHYSRWHNAMCED